MWTALLLILIGLTHQVLAQANVCADVNPRRLQLQIYAMNLANVITTRTPEGGPYKRIIIKSCVPTGCILEDDATSKLVFRPDHPDANRNGYVEYPNIDVEAELLSFEATFAELVTIAGQKKCGMELTYIDGASLVNYTNSDVKSDFLLHSVDGSVIWRRTHSDGIGQNVLLSEFRKNGSLY